MPITAVQLKTFFLCLLLSFSSTQVLLSQIPSCCRPDSENFQKQTMSCHSVPEADLTEEKKAEETKDKKWSNKSTICHCKPYLMSMLGIKPYYTDQAVLTVPAPESYEVPPHRMFVKAPSEVFMVLLTKPPISS